MNHPTQNVGAEIYSWMSDLWNVPRSLAGEGNRRTLSFLGQFVKGLVVHEIPSGTKVNDWIVPDEWEVREAWVEDLDGHRLVDYSVNHLHLVGYSRPFDGVVTADELAKHLYSMPELPQAIPYRTSYYLDRWGFCMSEDQRKTLKGDRFRVKVDTRMFRGSMSLGEVVIHGETDNEVLLSTNICHPSLANNELSGPTMLAALGRSLQSFPRLRFSYRLLFLPETIGPIAYLASNLEQMKARTIAGWQVVCVGDDNCFSFVPSRSGDSLSDRISKVLLEEVSGPVIHYTFSDRGSDERQWCWPGVDLPIASVTRSKYGEYPEYHSSMDDLSFVSKDGLATSFEFFSKAISLLEANFFWKATTVGEPHLGKRNLYPVGGERLDRVPEILEVLGLCDGSRDTVAICAQTGLKSSVVLGCLEKLFEAGLVVRLDSAR